MKAESQLIQAQNQRAEEVKKQIKALQGNLQDRTFELADLLEEAVENNYIRDWGYAGLEDWLAHSELDIKKRQAEYLIRINKLSKQLGITRGDLRQLKISKLKAIFSLDPEEHRDHIFRLMKEAVNMTLEEVEAEVRRIKGIEEEEMTWRNYRVTKDAAENTIDPAAERLKQMVGVEVSDGVCLEYMAAMTLSYSDQELANQLDEIHEKYKSEKEEG